MSEIFVMVCVDEWLSAFEFLWVPFDSGHRNRLKQKCTLRKCKSEPKLLKKKKKQTVI